MSEQNTDQELVKQVQKGNKNAFNLLVIRHQNKVMNIVARYVKNSGDVADVTQEAFIKAYRALPNFRGESAFYTWLYRIAVNCAKNHMVAGSRKPPSTDVEVEDADVDLGHVWLLPPTLNLQYHFIKIYLFLH